MTQRLLVLGAGTAGTMVVNRLRLLKETRSNHLGKLAFRWICWNVLLRGRPIPPPSQMSMVGKTVPTAK